MVSGMSSNMDGDDGSWLNSSPDNNPTGYNDNNGLPLEDQTKYTIQQEAALQSYLGYNVDNSTPISDDAKRAAGIPVDSPQHEPGSPTSANNESSSSSGSGTGASRGTSGPMNNTVRFVLLALGIGVVMLFKNYAQQAFQKRSANSSETTKTTPMTPRQVDSINSIESANSLEKYYAEHPDDKKMADRLAYKFLHENEKSKHDSLSYKNKKINKKKQRHH